jgi:hypothetical protein
MGRDVSRVLRGASGDVEVVSTGDCKWCGRQVSLVTDGERTGFAHKQPTCDEFIAAVRAKHGSCDEEELTSTTMVAGEPN